MAKGEVEVAEDAGRGEGFFEEGEYALALAVPVPWGVLSRPPVEGFSDPGVIINEPAVEVGETKEGLHLFHTPGRRPVEDGLHLSGIHANTVQGDYDTKVLNFGGVEQALLQFGV
ncbi:hypothetical protein C0993_000407 [Termitomyces sp. T159_Od127]|nr:hypothetical protein C0993_000407 [Termitomyces sp. T159_Od127]